MGGQLRGYKRGMYEGALRQAAISWWPGTVPAGRVTEEPWAFWDFLPTVVELTDSQLPQNIRTDGKSLVSFLKGGSAPERDYFYWELHEGKSIQAIRFGNWKAVRNGPSEPIELYNLETDTGEERNLADANPDLVKKAERLMTEAREEDSNWPLRDAKPKRKPK